MLDYILYTLKILLVGITGFVLWYAFVRVTLLAYFNTLYQIKRSKLRRSAIADIDAAEKQHSVHQKN